MTAQAMRAPYLGYADVGGGAAAGAEGIRGVEESGLHGQDAVRRQPGLSSKWERALRVGSKTGKLAAGIAAMTYALVSEAVPGGQAFAGLAAVAAGVLGRVVGTAGYFGGSYAGRVARKVASKAMDNPGVQAVVGRIRQVGQEVGQRPVVQRTVSAARQVSMVLKRAYDATRAHYPDYRRGGLDSWRWS